MSPYLVPLPIGRSDGRVVNGTDCSVNGSSSNLTGDTWLQVFRAMQGNCTARFRWCHYWNRLSSSSLSSIRQKRLICPRHDYRPLLDGWKKSRHIILLLPTYFRIFSCPISHATLWAWFNITKLLANLLTKPSVFLLLCQLSFVISFQ